MVYSGSSFSYTASPWINHDCLIISSAFLHLLVMVHKRITLAVRYSQWQVEAKDGDAIPFTVFLCTEPPIFTAVPWPRAPESRFHLDQASQRGALQASAKVDRVTVATRFCLGVFIYLCRFRSTPVAYGGLQAVAAGLRHSHSHAGSLTH